jgi:hypothetical protein
MLRRDVIPTKLHTHCPLTGGEPSLARLLSGTPVEGGQHPLIRIFLPASISTQRRTEDEAGSPRVADRSGPLAVLPSSPLVLQKKIYHDRREMTSLEFPFKWILQQEMDGKRYSDI